ncbi:Baculoviral IAP repeat-containing protein 7-B [Lamellibrachia satsuma]|nr:Baculoviral IAP repeat-containing protein 7-B [Lamellibrachia satsuma]
MRSLVVSIFLYASETWTLSADLQKRIQAMEVRCFRKILRISYIDHVSNEAVRNKIKQAIGPYDDLLTTVKNRKLKWYGHVSRSSGLAKTILQGTVRGGDEENVTSNTSDSTPAGQLGIETARPRLPAMAVEAARLASFDRWPCSSPVSPESLARAGFYCTGVPSEVCCFFCGGRLSRWQPNDDPMAKHRQLYPDCGFVRLNAEFVSHSAPDPQSERENATSIKIAAAADMEQQHTVASSQTATLTCKVCLDAETNIVFLPCGHLVCCANCAVAFSTCPVCRAAVQGCVRTFLA